MVTTKRADYKNIQKMRKKEAISSNRYMTLPRFFLLQLSILVFSGSMAVAIRSLDVRFTDYTTYLRSEVKEEWGHPDYTYLNNYVTGGKLTGSRLNPEEVPGKYLHAPEDKHLHLYTYEELFTEDPHEYATISLLFIFSLTALVTEVSILHTLTSRGYMVWYKEYDLPEWE